MVVFRPCSRRTCLLAAALLLLVCASAARLTVPGVRELTRATSTTRTVHREAHLRSQNMARALVHRAAGKAPGVVVFPPTRAKAVFPRPVNEATPPGRAPGDGLGTGSLPRSARWLVLGGHGRNGAG